MFKRIFFLNLLFLALFFSFVAFAQTPAALRPTAQELYDQAVSLRQHGQFLKAQEVYKNVLARHLLSETRRTIEKEFERVNLAVIASQAASPQTSIHVVAPGETLRQIARKYRTTIHLIKKRNHLESDLIRPGQKLSVWQGNFNIEIDKSANMLVLKNGAELFKKYQVSTGKNNSSPVGEFTIVEKLFNPVWFHKGVVVPPNAPDNYLGTRWLGLDKPKYGIHGTIEPELIGQPVSGGCIRMRNEDVEELYSLVPVGTRVVINE